MRPGEHPLPHGTGVLLEIGDTMFILTAAHVLDVGVDEVLLIWPGRSREHVVLNSMERNLSKEKNNVDLGIVRLSGYARTRILQEREAARLSEIEIGATTYNSMHAIFGYPMELSESDGVLGDRVSSAVLYPTVPHPSGFGVSSEDMSIVLQFDFDCVDRDGVSGRMPYPGGISGCGIWRLSSEFSVTSNWKPENIKLVGIAHSLIGESALKGTRIKHAMAGIARMYPEFRRRIELSLKIQVMM
jgi:hypothetical protein